MKYFAGLDISLKTTNLSIMDDGGHIVRRAKVQTDPGVLVASLSEFPNKLERIGLEAGAHAGWLYGMLVRAGLPVICVEARHAHQVLGARLNKTDRNDADGLADIMRMGLYRAVHYKSDESREIRAVLSTRAFVLGKMRDTENAIQGQLITFGIRRPAGKRQHYLERIANSIEHTPEASAVVAPLMAVWTTLYEQFLEIDRRAIAIAHRDPVCVRLMTAPYVGPMVALSFRQTIDVPQRFRHSQTVGAHLGLTQRIKASGEYVRRGRISAWGDRQLRSLLVNAAAGQMRSSAKPSNLRNWALAVADRRGRKKAMIALARRMAVILHRMWCSERDFDDNLIVAPPRPQVSTNPTDRAVPLESDC